MDLAQFAYHLRETGGITQKKLASCMGTTQSAIACLEGCGTNSQRNCCNASDMHWACASARCWRLSNWSCAGCYEWVRCPVGVVKVYPQRGVVEMLHGAIWDPLTADMCCEQWRPPLTVEAANEAVL